MNEEKLIEAVRGHECLYNTKIKEYKLNVIKTAAWEEISLKFKMPVPECKTRWNQLRNAYLHSIARRKSATGLAAKHFRKWKFEDEMSFLLPYMSQRDSGTSHEKEKDDPDHDPSIQDENLNENTIKIHTNNKRKVDYHGETSQLIKEREKYPTRKSERDEIDLLFESMAKAVKQLPKSEQIKVKMGMTKVLYEAQMRCENSQSQNIFSVSVSQFGSYADSPELVPGQSPSSYIPSLSPSSPQDIHESASPSEIDTKPPLTHYMGIQ